MRAGGGCRRTGTVWGVLEFAGRLLQQHTLEMSKDEPLRAKQGKGKASTGVLFPEETGGYLQIGLRFQSAALVSSHLLIMLLLCNLLGRVVLSVIQVKSQFLVLFQFMSVAAVCKYRYLKKVNFPLKKKSQTQRNLK